MNVLAYESRYNVCFVSYHIHVVVVYIIYIIANIGVHLCKQLFVYKYIINHKQPLSTESDDGNNNSINNIEWSS